MDSQRIDYLVELARGTLSNSTKDKDEKCYVQPDEMLGLLQSGEVEEIRSIPQGDSYSTTIKLRDVYFTTVTAVPIISELGN